MKKLLVDAGNSSIKWSLLDGEQLSKMQSYQYGKRSSIETYFGLVEEQLKTSKIDEVIMVSVLGDSYIETVKKYTHQVSLKFFNVESSANIAGVKNAYAEPHKLGTDRLVAMVAAYHLDQNKVSIVIDSGTATTIDAVDSKGQHLGGLILPGIDLCGQSLLEKTEQLALFNENDYLHKPNIFSSNTKQAIASGSLYGLAGAIENICVKMEEEIKRRVSPNTKGEHIIRVLICGGSAEKLLPHLPEKVIHCNNLIMQGLKFISESEKGK